MAKRWVVLTDEYASKIKNMTVRKIRVPRKILFRGENREKWARWDSYEKCFFQGDGENFTVYLDEPQNRPIEIQIG